MDSREGFEEASEQGKNSHLLIMTLTDTLICIFVIFTRLDFPALALFPLPLSNKLSLMRPPDINERNPLQMHNIYQL